MPLPTIPEKLAKIIERCDRDIVSLTGELLLAENLTGGGENPLSKKVQDALDWTREVRGLCLEYQEKEAVLYPFLFTKVEKLTERFYDEFNHARWNEPCGEMVADSNDQNLASLLNYRKHMISHSLSTAGQLENLQVILRHNLSDSGVDVPTRER